MKLEQVVIETQPEPNYSIIWLHGLGADGFNFVPIVKELNLPEELAIRFIFPHAPMRPITLNQGYVMRGWYDIIALDASAPEDAEGIHLASQAINNLIESEHLKGIPYENIFLAGFSQGGALALYTAIRSSQPLGGILALSCYLPLPLTTMESYSKISLNIPVFMAHGIYDEIVPLVLGEHSRRLLQRLGYQIDWQTYPMAHEVCLHEIADIQKKILEFTLFK